MNIESIMPYCQILGKDISSSRCFEIQGQEACFGCAAPTRLCESCKDKFIEVPAIGFCSQCLSQKLVQEKETDKSVFGTTIEVSCQVFQKLISAEMCLATQGQEGCRNCLAVSRLCENCKKRLCKFPQYGLCLNCAVKEFGEGWRPEKLVSAGGDIMNNKTGKKKRREERNVSHFLPKARDLAIKSYKISALFISNELEMPYTKARLVLKKLEKEGLVGPPRGTASREVLIPGKEKDELYNEAVRLVFSVQKASASLLQRHLKIGYARAARLLDMMENKGIIGPLERIKSREVYAKQDSSSSLEDISLDQMIKQFESFIAFIGQDGNPSLFLQKVVSELKKWREVKRTIFKIK